VTTTSFSSDADRPFTDGSATGAVVVVAAAAGRCFLSFAGAFSGFAGATPGPMAVLLLLLGCGPERRRVTERFVTLFSTESLMALRSIWPTSWDFGL
jgi:hypothetical protein